MRVSSSAETCIIWVFFIIENLNENLNEVLPRLVRNRKPDFKEQNQLCKVRRRASGFVSRLFKIQNNHRDHKDPSYCTNQNLLRQDSQLETAKLSHNTRKTELITRSQGPQKKIRTLPPSSDHQTITSTKSKVKSDSGQPPPSSESNEKRNDQHEEFAVFRTETASTRRHSTSSSRQWWWYCRRKNQEKRSSNRSNNFATTSWRTLNRIKKAMKMDARPQLTIVSWAPSNPMQLNWNSTQKRWNRMSPAYRRRGWERTRNSKLKAAQYQEPIEKEEGRFSLKGSSHKKKPSTFLTK